MIDYKYKDKYGYEISPEEWWKLFNDYNYKFLARDKLDGYIISTFWIGFPKNPWDDYDLFQTIVFPNFPVGIWHVTEKKYYNTIEDATIGHVDLVNKWKKVNETH